MTTNTQFLLYFARWRCAYLKLLDPKIKWKLMLGSFIWTFEITNFWIFGLKLRMKLSINQGANWFTSCGHWSPYPKLKWTKKGETRSKQNAEHGTNHRNSCIHMWRNELFKDLTMAPAKVSGVNAMKHFLHIKLKPFNNLTDMQ